MFAQDGFWQSQCPGRRPLPPRPIARESCKGGLGGSTAYHCGVRFLCGPGATAMRKTVWRRAGLAWTSFHWPLTAPMRSTASTPATMRVHRASTHGLLPELLLTIAWLASRKPVLQISQSQAPARQSMQAASVVAAATTGPGSGGPRCRGLLLYPASWVKRSFAISASQAAGAATGNQGFVARPPTVGVCRLLVLHEQVATSTSGCRTPCRSKCRKHKATGLAASREWDTQPRAELPYRRRPATWGLTEQALVEELIGGDSASRMAPARC